MEDILISLQAHREMPPRVLLSRCCGSVNLEGRVTSHLGCSVQPVAIAYLNMDQKNGSKKS